MDFSKARPPNGSTFDPEGMRLFSVLPDEDMDEAYCVRHDREMTELELVAFHQGAEYELAPRFHAVTCENCAAEAGSKKGVEPVELLRVYGYKTFEAWNDGEALGEWFEFVCESEQELPEGGETFVNVMRADGDEQ